MCDKDIVTMTCYNKTSQMDKNEVIVKCYGKITKYLNRNLAIKEYTIAVLCSEGSERERYAKILAELIDNYIVCSDE